MARDFPGTTTDLMTWGDQVVAPLIHGASAVSYSVWINADSFSSVASLDNRIFEFVVGLGALVQTGGLMAINDTGANPNLIMFHRSRREGGDSETLTHSTTILTGLWYHIAAVCDFGNDIIRVYVNGVKEQAAVSWASPTFSHSPSSLHVTRDRIGGSVALVVPGTQYQFNGRIAGLTVWPIDIGDDVVNALYHGADSFRVHATSPVVLDPLWGDHSPEIDLSINNKQLTISGTIPKADHAPVQPFTIPNIPNVLDIGPGPPAIFPENYDVIIEDAGLIVVADGSTYNVVVDNSTMDIEVPT